MSCGRVAQVRGLTAGPRAASARTPRPQHLCTPLAQGRVSSQDSLAAQRFRCCRFRTPAADPLPQDSECSGDDGPEDDAGCLTLKPG